MKSNIQYNTNLDTTCATEAWNKLSTQSTYVRNKNLRARELDDPIGSKNGEDLIHDLIAHSKTLPPEKQIKGYLEKDFLSLLPPLLSINRNEECVVVLPKKLGIFFQSSEGVFYRKTAATDIQTKLLHLFSKKRYLTKEQIVHFVWGYKYQPLRHDSLVYAAIRGLRKALGKAAIHLTADEQAGYSFAKKIIFFQQESIETTKAEAAKFDMSERLFNQLNHRQIQIIEWAQKKQFLSVQECQERFDTSEASALRDLRGLVHLGHLTRIGKARATKYTLRN